MTEKVDVLLAAPNKQSDGVHEAFDRQANGRSHIDQGDQRDPEHHKTNERSQEHQWGASCGVKHER
ncbi:hypothetical protein D9M70_588940 [compost metagenome]